MPTIDHAIPHLSAIVIVAGTTIPARQASHVKRSGDQVDLMIKRGTPALTTPWSGR